MAKQGTYIALLRAINVGGNRKVAMSDLRELIAVLGFDGPQTLLQTGNVVFSGSVRSTEPLERLLETEAEKRLGLQTAFLIRTADQWKAIIAQNPFPDEAKSDPSHLVVLVLKGAPSAGAVKALQAASKGPEIIRAKGKQLYIIYPDGIGRSKLTMKLMEGKLGTIGTGRNWNTVLKIGAMISA